MQPNSTEGNGSFNESLMRWTMDEMTDFKNETVNGSMGRFVNGTSGRNNSDDEMENESAYEDDNDSINATGNGSENGSLVSPAWLFSCFSWILYCLPNRSMFFTA